MAPPLGKRGAPVQEDAAQLILGEEFDGAGCLMVSEVQFLLDDARAAKTGGEETSSVYSKTRSYIDVFANASLHDVRAIRAVLQRDTEMIKPFELAQLGNIMPDTVEMAKSLIPSLTRLEDDRLQSLLDELQVMKNARQQ